MQRSTLIAASLCLLLGFFQQDLFAQKPVRIYLDNGWVLQGDTSHLKQKKALQIQSQDQQIFSFPMSQIDSIRTANFPMDKIGFQNLFHLGFLMHNPEPVPGVDPSLIGNFFSLSIQYTASFHAGKGMNLGAGTGINLFNRGYVMPLYADLRKDLGKGMIRPHFYVQAGTSIPLYGREEIEDFWGNTIFEEFKASGGLLLETGLGLKFYSFAPYAWTLSLGWRLQQITEDYKQWEIRYKDEYSFQRISFQIGMIF